MKLLVLSFLCVLFVGCDGEITGIFESYDDLSLKDHRGNFIKIDSREYDASIKARSRRKVSLILRSDEGKKEIRFRIPKNFDLKKEGSVFLSSDLSGQPYDIAGENLYTTYQTELVRTHEYCSESVPIERCFVDQYGNLRCRLEYVLREGRRRVEYYNIVTNGDHRFTFNRQDRDMAIASFRGNSKKEEKKYDYFGHCRIRRQYRRTYRY